MDHPVEFLRTQHELEKAIADLGRIEWFGFDTEFVGEKTYIPKLCLLQFICKDRIFLVDTLEIKNLDVLIRIVEDPDILKVTHAGDNDYRLLNQLYGTVPQNTFDTQIAAGFTGYNYPAAFRKIVEKELKISLSKSHTVADWEARPLSPRALDYAIEDVKYLPELHERLSWDLDKRKRTSWAREENRKWESAEFYQYDPKREILGNDLIYKLDFKQKIFLVRLVLWRRETAAKLDVPKETVLQSRHMATVVKAVTSGQQGHKANRTLPESVWKRHSKSWQSLHSQPHTDEEVAFIKSLPKPSREKPVIEWSMELMYHFVRRQCLLHEISAALLLPRGDFNKLKNKHGFDESLLTGWRAELLGEPLLSWLKEGKEIDANWAEDFCTLRMKNE